MMILIKCHYFEKLLRYCQRHSAVAVCRQNVENNLVNFNTVVNTLKTAQELAVYYADKKQKKTIPFFKKKCVYLCKQKMYLFVKYHSCP